MESFFGICVLSALVAAGTTQPTHNSPHDVWQTQHQMQPEHHMSQREDRMSQPEHYPSQPQHHMGQTEHHGSQPNHYSQPQHGFESWSTAEAQAQPQRTWSVPKQPHYQPVEILSQPIPAQPHSIHSQPLPIDPQFELHPYPYQHPHYPPMGSHHSQDVYPTHGWNMQNPVYENPLPEAPPPEHRIDSFKEDYPNQSSAFANAEASSNSEPISNNESSNPQHFKIVSIPKADNGAEYNLPVVDHETRRPRVVHMSNDEGLPDIVKEILAKYRPTPIKIKPKAKPDNAPKEHEPEGYGPAHRPHKHIRHKIPTIPVVTKQTAKTKAVAVAKTDTDKTFTIFTGGKHRTTTKAPRKHIHKHSHKKQLKPLLDPELLAKELQLLSKELWLPSPDKTHEKDVPCDDNPIVTDPDDSNCEDESNSLDKNKPKDKHHHEKHSEPHLSAAMTPEKTTTASTYIKSDDKKDQKDNDTDCDSCYDDNNPEKDDKRKNHEHKPIINEKQITDSKPVDSQIENKDLKETEVLEKKQLKKEFIKEVDAKKEKIEQYVPAMKQYNEKPNSKIDQKDAVKNNDLVSPSPDENTEPCDYDFDPKLEKEGKKHDVLTPKTDEKPKHDLNKNKPKHSHPHTPIIIVPEKDIAKTTTPSSNVKPDQNDGDKDNDCDSTDRDVTTEHYDTESTPGTVDGRKKHLPKPETEKKHTDPKPVDNKKNTDTIIDHTIVHKKEITKVKSKVETMELEKIKPQSEISVKNQKPEQDYNKPVSNDSDSTEVSITNLPYDNNPASQHKEEKKKLLPKAIKDNNKPVSPETGKEDKLTTITKKDVKKVEQKIELTQKVETVKKDQNPKKYKDKLKPEKQENKSSNIEDSDSTESSEREIPLDQTPAPENKRELKEPLPKGNKNSKDLSKEKKTINKKGVTAKVEIKTKKSIKKVVSTESVDESKPVETSNGNSSIDDCDSANSETDPKPDQTKTIKENNDAKKKKAEEVTKKTATIAKNKAKGKATGQHTNELTQKVVTEKEDQNQTIKNVPEPKKDQDKLKPENQENNSSDIEDSNSTESSEREIPLDKTPAPENKRELKEHLPKGNKNSKDLTKEKKTIDKKGVTAKVEIKTKKSIKKVVSTESVDESKPVDTSNENSSIDDCDSANSETNRKPDKPKIIKENNDAKKKKTEEVTKKTVIAKNKAEGKATGQELTSDEVAEILEKTETDESLSTIGFLLSFISHALHGSDSVKQMFEEPKVKTFLKDIFHGKPKE